MSKAVTEEVEKEVQKAIQEEIQKNIQKGMSQEAAEAAAKASTAATREAASETVLNSAERAVASGTATAEQKEAAGFWKDTKDYFAKNPKTALKLTAAGVTAAAVVIHMIQHGETDPAQAIAEMASSDLNKFISGLFGPYKNWILGGLGVIFLITIISLIYKLF